MTAPRVDVAVIGLGAAGSAALSSLARSGARVLGLDAYAPPHALGSSHGETRMLRTAYSEGPAYVPMVRRAIGLWRDLEARRDLSLFRQTGVAYFGPQGTPFLEAAKEAARHGDVALERRDTSDPSCRLSVPADWEFLFDRDGGYLDAEGDIAAFLAEARDHGADIRPDCACMALLDDAHGVTVETSQGAFRADRVVVAAGSWTNELLPRLKSVTHVERRVLHWFADPDGQCGSSAGFLPFLVEYDGAGFYGFPANPAGEVKVAEHFIRQRVASPDTLDRTVSQHDIDFIMPLMRRFLPGLGAHRRAAVCHYPMSRDEHFIVDRLAPRIVVGAGLSGHGFKFAPVIGEALANLAVGADQHIDVEYFALKRFAEFR